MIDAVASVLKALGEPTRLKIVRLLGERELCVCELEALLEMSQPRVSQHIKVLKNAGVIKERKDRQRSFFSLKEEFLGGQISGYTGFINTPLDDIPEMAAERQRMVSIDDDQDIQACRAGCIEAVKLPTVG